MQSFHHRRLNHRRKLRLYQASTFVCMYSRHSQFVALRNYWNYDPNLSPQNAPHAFSLTETVSLLQIGLTRTHFKERFLVS